MPSWYDPRELAKGGYHFFDWMGGGEADRIKQRGAQDVSDQYKGFSDEQWRRQMEGLDKAQGAYAPSQQYWNSTYGSQGPGAMENWWNQNQSQFNRQPTQQQAYNGYTDWMSNGVNATQQGANAANQYLGGPTASSQAWGSMGQGLQNYSGPQSGMEAYRYNQPSYQQAGAGENWWNQNQNRYNQETNSQSQYELSAGDLRSVQSGAEAFAKAGFKGSGELNVANMRAQKFADAPTTLQMNEGENKGYLRNANQLSDYYGSQQGALMGPGQYEQFVTADINGTNPAFQRQRAEGIAKINQEMARRGTFNSGGALTAIGNYTGALDAADYENRANRAKSAQEMQLARIGQGTQSAQAAAGLDIQRGQGLGSLDTANEQAQAARIGMGITGAEAKSMENDRNFKNELSMHEAADKGRLDRLMGIGQLAGQADSQNLGLLNAGQSASNAAQEQMLARLMGYQNSANSVDQTRLASDNQALQRMLASFNMAQGSDASGLARAQQLFAQGQGLDQNMMNRFGQQAEMGRGIDQQILAQLMGGGQMAGNAQDAQQQRMAQAFGSLFGLNDAQAGQYSKFYGQGGAQSGAAFNEAMKALMAKYGYKADESGADLRGYMEMLGIAGKVFGS